MVSKIKKPLIKCPVILSAFKIDNKAQSKCLFDFSIINLFDELRQPSIPYFPKEVDYEKIKKMILELDKNINNVTQEKLRHFGRLLWNHVIPREVGNYLAELEEEYSIQILLVTNDIHIPWEIVHDNSDFWSLKYSIGRIYGMSNNYSLRFPIRGKSKNTKGPSLLLIYDPEDNLPHAKEEGNKLKRKLNKRYNIVSLSGRVNAFDIALEIGSDDYDIIHFAGHAVMGESSALKGFNSKLEGSDIAGYSLPRHPVVFANACSTGAKGYYGINSKNIAEAFIEAGAAAFIGTLWKISDKLSADFAAQLYEYLLDGKTIGDSLILTKNKLSSKSGEYDIDWAAFTLFGNPDSRLFTTTPKENLLQHRIQITMSNAPGTLGKILVAMGKLDVNIVRGRSITFTDEKKAGYIAEIEIKKDADGKSFLEKMNKKLPKGLIFDIQFF